MKRFLFSTAASVVAVILSGVFLPRLGIDFVFPGWPFAFASVKFDGGNFYFLSFLLDVVVFLLPLVLLSYLFERIVPKMGIKESVIAKARTGIAIIAVVLVAWLAAVVLFASNKSSWEEYRRKSEEVSLGDVTLRIEMLPGAIECSSIPFFWRHFTYKTPYGLSIAANVNRSDYELVIHSASLKSTSLGDCSVIPAGEEVVIPLHSQQNAYEVRLESDSVEQYYVSPKDIALDFAKDKEFSLNLSVSLRRGTEVIVRDFEIRFERAFYGSCKRRWNFYWGLQRL